MSYSISEFCILLQPLSWLEFHALTAKLPALMYSLLLDPTWNPYLLRPLISICTTHVVVNSYFLRFFVSKSDSHTVINSKTVFYHIYSCHLDPNHTINFILDLYFDIYDIKINLNFFCYLNCHLCLYRLYIEVRFLSYTYSIWNKTLHIKYLFIFMWNAYITIINFNTRFIYFYIRCIYFLLNKPPFLGLVGPGTNKNSNKF
jgi:hypothetical protein